MGAFATFGLAGLRSAMPGMRYRLPVLAFAGAGARKSLAVLVLLCGFALVPGLGADKALARGPDSLADLAAQVSDAVVNISATQTFDDKQASAGPPAEGTPFDDLFEEFRRRHRQGGGDVPVPRPHERKSNSLGSGFVIDSVRNHHHQQSCDRRRQ